MLRTLFFTFTLLALTNTFTNAQTARDIIDDMLDSFGELRTLEYDFYQNEQLRKGRNEYLAHVRLQINPQKVYVKTISPDKGIEVLYRDGHLNNKALINPNGFPYVNVKLDPLSGQLMKDRHHPIFRSGFKPIERIMRKAIKRADEESVNVLTRTADDAFDGKECYKVELNDPTFGYVNYTVKSGENLCTISDRLNIGDYMIMLQNPKISDFKDVSAGDVIRIPTSYSKRTVIWVEKDTMLPIKLKMFDEKGVLYEQFEFRNMQINPSFPSNEFTENGPGYGF